jgi:hypothetical protein
MQIKKSGFIEIGVDSYTCFQPSLLSNTDEISRVKDAFGNKQGIKDFFLSLSFTPFYFELMFRFSYSFRELRLRLRKHRKPSAIW